MTTAPSVEPNRLWLSIEVRTWHTFDKETGLVRPLTHEEWRARKAKFDTLGLNQATPGVR